MLATVVYIFWCVQMKQTQKNALSWGQRSHVAHSNLTVTSSA